MKVRTIILATAAVVLSLLMVSEWIWSASQPVPELDPASVLFSNWALIGRTAPPFGLAVWLVREWV